SALHSGRRPGAGPLHRARASARVLTRSASRWSATAAARRLSRVSRQPVGYTALRDLATSTIQSQSAAINQMTNWLARSTSRLGRTRYGTALPALLVNIPSMPVLRGVRGLGVRQAPWGADHGGVEVGEQAARIVHEPEMECVVLVLHPRVRGQAGE